LARLPYEESSIKMGNTQEVHLNKGLLDRVEARQEYVASSSVANSSQINRKIGPVANRVFM
jgi:hypothetical protein